MEKKKDGAVQGSFTIRVSNSTKIKNLFIERIISSTFPSIDFFWQSIC